MPKMTVRFSQLVQDSQDFGSNDEHMVSRAYFDLVCDGKTTTTYADVKLVVGGNFVTDSLEVGRPVGYKGPLDHAQFSDAVTRYVRSAVGPTAKGIRIGPGSSVRMRNNTFRFPLEVSFEVKADPGGW